MSQETGLNRRNFLKGAGMTALAGAAAPAVAIADDDEGGGLFKNGNYDFETVYERGGWNCARWDSPAKRYPEWRIQVRHGGRNDGFRVRALYHRGAGRAMSSITYLGLHGKHRFSKRSHRRIQR